MNQPIVSFIEKEFLPASTKLESMEEELLTGGIINSLGLMKLISFIENQYAISIPFEDITLEHFNTIEVITAYVSERLDTSH
ncbi:MAG: acyl carrier protein [Flavobacteriaceae bacterium]